MMVVEVFQNITSSLLTYPICLSSPGNILMRKSSLPTAMTTCVVLLLAKLIFFMDGCFHSLTRARLSVFIKRTAD